MSSRDSGQGRHLFKLRRNLSECTTFSRPESTYWNNVTVMLFFHKRWWLKKKKFPNRRTVLSSAWSDRCGVTSGRFWPAVYWKKSDPVFFFGRESFMSMSNVFFQGKKERDIGELLLPRTRNILVPKTEFITPKNYGFFFSQRTIIWRRLLGPLK